MNSEKFQKQLAWVQIVATSTVAFGAVIISIGLTIMSLFVDIPLPAENRIKFDVFVQMILYIGVAIICLGLGLSYLRIKKLRLDETTDLLEDKLKEEKVSGNNNNEQNVKWNPVGISHKIKLLIIGLTASVVIEASMIIISQDYSKITFDYEFFKDIIIVFIPVVAGIFSSKLIVNSWQIRKEQLKLQKEISEALEKSISKSLVVMDNFVRVVNHAYVVYKNDQSVDADGYVKVDIVFTDLEQDLPINKFAAEYKQFHEDYNQINFDTIYFKSILKLYYDKPTVLESEYKKLIQIDGEINHEIEKLIRARNATEYSSYYELINTNLEDLKEKIGEYRVKLLSEKIRKPNI